MKKLRKFVSEKENDLYVNAMLEGNEIIENALGKWSNNQKDICAMLEVYKSIVDRDRECGGLIVSVESNGIPAGADNIEFFNGDKTIRMNRSKGASGDKYILVFTSRDRFREYNDTAGVVMFIRELFSLLGEMEGIDGIVVNLHKEEILFSKQVMQQISRLIEVGEEKR